SVFAPGELAARSLLEGTYPARLPRPDRPSRHGITGLGCHVEARPRLRDREVREREPVEAQVVDAVRTRLSVSAERPPPERVSESSGHPAVLGEMARIGLEHAGADAEVSGLEERQH